MAKYFHFDYILGSHDKKDISEEALDRILDNFIEGVEKENCGVGGGVHEAGKLDTCDCEGDDE